MTYKISFSQIAFGIIKVGTSLLDVGCVRIFPIGLEKFAIGWKNLAGTMNKKAVCQRATLSPER